MGYSLPWQSDHTTEQTGCAIVGGHLSREAVMAKKRQEEKGRADAKPIPDTLANVIKALVKPVKPKEEKR